MACDPQTLVAANACQFACLSGRTLAAIRIRLLCAIIDGTPMACDAQTLVTAASCIESCIPVGLLPAVEIALLCQIASTGTGGGGGSSSSGVTCGDVAPVAAPTGSCGLYYQRNTGASPGAFYYWDAGSASWVQLIGG